MLPIAIVNNTTPIQVPLAGTTLPGSTATHVPYDNVAPSISNSQVNNNASPNSTAAAGSDQPEVNTDEPDATGEQISSAVANNPAQGQSGAQATFLAQLMSQDGSPPAQAILIQYEKLIAVGIAKYKPSNASKPPPSAPASAFGQILQQSKTGATGQPATPTQPASRQAVPAPVANTGATTDATTQETIVSAAAPAPRPPTPTRSGTTPANTNTSGASQPAANSAPQIINAYTATASRVNSQSLETTTELA